MIEPIHQFLSTLNDYRGNLAEILLLRGGDLFFSPKAVR